ncbi:23S rRNA (adenine(1618)-N(6))-methyltransferase RlmF [Litoribacter ruber]|uniref:23S rRNA (adenine(1618)-N(6))-methyltransferase RlmF n=1 Tax=Litoribacter ruber TaxID=702568 RepID=UPI001BDA1502|nr:23S rRNA (adenine(1618)-N(6))-methyltransferase RlmF [Litoribacter ruber]MBT0810204.1 23S rRNA (adenine(1618)-N(6))-methyltransferase RlmF [Litoribacter ruber]
MKEIKHNLHPENIHRFGYDFEMLIKADPRLKAFVKPNPYGNLSIEFADPKAVLALNRSLLLAHYQIKGWRLPPDHLCPPIPGRADYLHYVSDLFPDKANLKGLDIGTGASGIYALLGASLFNWDFIASDIDKKSLQNVARILSHNPQLQDKIELRHQENSRFIFRNVLEMDERMDFTICNPPFHTSAKEAAQGTQRKNRNLKLNTKTLNFGGKNNELWYPGGELKFVSLMIRESEGFQKNCTWFTSLISKKENLPHLLKVIEEMGASPKIVDMSQGQKKSRMLAWSYGKM